MKVIINTSYGGISDESAALRYNEQFIDDVESGRFVGRVMERYGFAETLRVVEVPDNATDYKIINYDGCEGVVYCCYGKLHYVGTEECKRIFEDNF